MSSELKIDSNTFVCQLPKEDQEKIKTLVTEHCIKEEYSTNETKEILESVFENRLWNIEEIIDIKQFETSNSEIEKCKCSECEKNSKTCLHYNTFRRLPKSEGGLGLCPKLKNRK